MSRRRQSGWGVLFDMFMMLMTGGLWLLWVAVRYMRDQMARRRD